MINRPVVLTLSLMAALSMHPRLAAGPIYSFTTFTIPGYDAYDVVYGINDLGQVVGNAVKVTYNPPYTPPESTQYAYLRDSGGAITELTVPGFTVAEPRGINNAGQITLIARTSNNDLDRSGFLRAADGSYIPLDFLPLDINDLGQIVGSSGTESVLRDADGTVHTWPRVPGVTTCGAHAINNGGQIAGSFYGAAGEVHGNLRSADGSDCIQFDVPGAELSYSRGTWTSGINDRGEVVGYFDGSDGNRHGFLRGSDGAYTTIDLPGALSTQIADINNRGQIAGSAFLMDMTYVGFIGTPVSDVPEPATAAISGTALVLLAVLLRRRKLSRCQ